MKSLFATIDSLDQGRMIIFWQEDQHKMDQIFSRENENSDIITYKDNIKSFLQQTSYFGLIQNSNFLGTTADFIIDFFEPAKKSQIFKEILIDNNIYLTQQLELQIYNIIYKLSKNSNIKSMSIIINIKKEAQAEIDYIRYCQQFIIKSLELLQEENNYITTKIEKCLGLMNQFENRITSLATEFEKQKLSLTEMKVQIKEIANEHLSQCDLRKKFLNLFISIKEYDNIQIAHFRLHCCNYNRPSKQQLIKIKPYQTLLQSKQKMQEFYKNQSHRFHKFISVISKQQSFEELSIKYNMPMHEIEKFVNHILLSLHKKSQLKAILINKITSDTYFVTKERPTNKDIQKCSDICIILQFLNEPRTYEQLKVYLANIGYNEPGEIYGWLARGLIKICQVFLYKINPFMTEEELDEIIKSKIHHENNEDQQNKIKSERQKLSLILERCDKELIIEEISEQIGLDITSTWRYIKQYENVIGYYIL